MISLARMLDAVRPGTTVVCIDDRQQLDVNGFRQRTGRLAAWLLRQPQRRYAIALERPVDFICALFALMAAGKVPLVLGGTAPGYLASLTGAYDAMLDDLALEEFEAQANDVTPFLPELDPQSLIIFTTSGSTGEPKLVHKRLAQLDAEVATLEQKWGLQLEGAVTLASVPHYHLYGMVFHVLWPLAAGRVVDGHSCRDLHQIMVRCDAVNHRAVLISTPAHLASWIDTLGVDVLARLIAVFSSASPLPAELSRRYVAEHDCALLEIYGSTETGAVAWREQRESDIWWPLPGVEVRCMEALALEVRSPYLDERDRWHRSDDAATMADGGFRLGGRLDRVIKVAGRRVSLVSLETNAMTHALVAQAVALPAPSAPQGRPAMVAILREAGWQVLQEQGYAALIRQLRRHLVDFFEPSVLPRQWRFVTELPFDVRGKLTAQALRALFMPRPEGFQVLAHARPGNGTERYVLRVPYDLAHFDGHFPGMPILPGVVQVDWAVRMAAHWLGRPAAIANLDRLKFTAPVGPGAILTLDLQHNAAHGRTSFRFEAGGRTCTAAMIVWKEEV